MKLLINGLILSSQNTGLGIYTSLFIEKVCPLLKNQNIKFDILVRSLDFLPSDLKKNGIVVNYSNFISRNYKAKKYYNSDYDLVVSTTQHGVIKCKNKQIITIHDLTPLFFPKGRIHQYLYYKFLLPKIIKKSDAIITVSNNTKMDIIKNYGVSEKKINVIYCSIKDNSLVKSNVDYDVLEKYKLVKDNFYCVTGIHYPYKNLHLIVNAYSKSNDIRSKKVVFIGNDNCKYGQQLKHMIKKHGLNDYFIFTGYISENEKNSLISSCYACIYPSLYEGFGLPLLESMRYGKLILSSNASCLPEIGKNGAIYFDGNSVDDFISKVNFINDESNVSKIIEVVNNSRKVLESYSWDSTAKKIFELILKYEVK